MHFFIDFFIDFLHYSDVNSLSSQYKVGDVIYLTGSHAGMNFDIEKKYYIQNIIFTDSGREVNIQAKSLDSVVVPDFQKTLPGPPLEWDLKVLEADADIIYQRIP